MGTASPDLSSSLNAWAPIPNLVCDRVLLMLPALSFPHFLTFALSHSHTLTFPHYVDPRSPLVEESIPHNRRVFCYTIASIPP